MPCRPAHSQDFRSDVAGRRVVLTAIEANEPMLSSKITGPGQRATLSAVIADGMRAVTIRVNDVDGVAGFVLPGDRVDVALTRQADKNNTNDVVLQNIKVLAIDQTADERTDKPSIARAVTLEVDSTDAQKLALAVDGRNTVADAAPGRRSKSGGHAQGDAWRPAPTVRRRSRKAKTPRFATDRRASAGKRDDVSVPIEDAGSTAGSGRAGACRSIGQRPVSGKLKMGGEIKMNNDHGRHAAGHGLLRAGVDRRSQSGSRKRRQERAGSSRRWPRWRR